MNLEMPMDKRERERWVRRQERSGGEEKTEFFVYVFFHFAYARCFFLDIGKTEQSRFELPPALLHEIGAICAVAPCFATQ